MTVRCVFDRNSCVYGEQLSALDGFIGQFDEVYIPAPVFDEFVKNKPYKSDMEKYTNVSVVPVTEEDRAEVYLMQHTITPSGKNLGMTEKDWYVLAHAKKLDCPFASEDVAVISAGKKLGLKHVSLPELVDNSAVCGLISEKVALAAFKKIPTEILKDHYIHECYLFCQKYEVYNIKKKLFAVNLVSEIPNPSELLGEEKPNYTPDDEGE